MARGLDATPLEPPVVTLHSLRVAQARKRPEPKERGPFGRVATIAGIIGILGFLAYNQFGGRGGPIEGAAAPAFSAARLVGDPFDLADTQGKVVVLDFWATWCPPCIKTLPALQKVHEHYEGNDDVVIASVNTDTGKNRKRQVELFMKNNRYGFPVLLDEAFFIQNAYRIQSIPTMVILDREGMVRHVKVGLTTSNTDKIAETIQSLVDGAM